MRIARDAIAIVVAVVSFGLVPVFSSPFGGCSETGAFVGVTGCGWWPEFFRGFVFLAALVILANHKRLLAGIGVGVVLVVVLLGGAQLLFTGEAQSYFRTHIMEVGAHMSSPLFVGAVASAVFFLACFSFMRSENFSGNA